MIISNFKVFIVFVALGLPFPQVHLSVEGGGGSTGFLIRVGGYISQSVSSAAGTKHWEGKRSQ